MNQTLGDIAEGTLLKVKENESLVEVIVLQHGFPESNNDGNTLVSRNECVTKMKLGRLSTYPNGDIDTWLNSEYLERINESLRNQIETVGITCYTSRTESEVIERKVFLLSYTEVGFSGSSDAMVEGSPISYFDGDSKRIANYNGSPVEWLLRTERQGYLGAFIVTKTGDSYFTNNSTLHGVRPAFVLPNNLFISDNDEILGNVSPEITGTDGDLGSFGETSPTYNYTVTDQDGGTVSVTEALDGETLRTYTVTLGQQNTLTIPAATYLTTLNGTHTLTITATDSVGASTTRTETFTKNVTSCAFTQTDVFAADDMPTRCVVTIQGSFPKGSTPKVEICNNGNDASPAWEDITQPALYRQKYFFKNQTKTASTWGVKLRASLDRGTAEGDCNITHIGGVFQ